MAIEELKIVTITMSMHLTPGVQGLHGELVVKNQTL